MVVDRVAQENLVIEGDGFNLTVIGPALSAWRGGRPSPVVSMSISMLARPSASSIGRGLTEDRRRYASPRSSSRNDRRQLFSAASGFASRSKKAVTGRLPLTFQP
jgi:hypothetical protein